MNKMAFSFIFIFSMFLVSCTNNQSVITSSSCESDLYSISHDIFYYRYSAELFELSEILDLSSSVSNDTEIAYLKGRIDGFLKNDTYEFSVIQRAEKNSKHPIVHPMLQSKIYNLLNDIVNYTSKLQSVVQNKNISNLKERKQEFTELIRLSKSINVHDLDEKDNVRIYSDLIDKMLKIMKEAK